MNYNQTEAESQFIAFLAENGFDVSRLNLKVGKDERCAVIGDKSKQTSGRYKFFLDSRANGWCINYKEGGEFVRWTYQFTEEERREWGRKKREQEMAEGKIYNPDLSEEDRKALLEKQKLEDQERQRLMAEREEAYRIKKEKEDAEAELIFEEVCDAIELEIEKYAIECVRHPYLDKKGVSSHQGLYQLMVSYEVPNLVSDEDEIQTFDEGSLLIPLYNSEGRLVTYQTINDDGSVKKFRVNAKKHGAFFVIGADNLEELEELYYTEGYATGASLHEFSGKPVICCFDVGNLAAVFAILKEMYPDKKHVICSDNDYYKYCKKISEGAEKAKNVGLEAAISLQEEHGAYVVFPVFPKHNPSSDWNDLANRFNPEIAKMQFDFQIEYTEKHKHSIREDESVMRELCESCFH